MLERSLEGSQTRKDLEANLPALMGGYEMVFSFGPGFVGLVMANHSYNSLTITLGATSLIALSAFMLLDGCSRASTRTHEGLGSIVARITNYHSKGA